MGNIQLFNTSTPQLSNLPQLPLHPSLPNLTPSTTQSPPSTMSIKPTFSHSHLTQWSINTTLSKHSIPPQSSRHLFFPISTHYIHHNLCSHTGYSIITFQYCPITLNDQIINRDKQKIKFKEKQIWYLMYGLVGLADELHKNGIVIGDVRPINVFITQKGEVKVMTVWSLPDEVCNINKTINMGMPTFLAPEQNEAVKNYQKYKNTHSNILQQHKQLQKLLNYTSPTSQCFSIGLTLLCTCILQQGQQIYLPPRSFRYDILQQYLKFFSQSTTYSDSLKLLIKGLCQVDSQKRLTCKEIMKCIKPYKKEIYGLENFKIVKFDEKICRKLDKQEEKGKIQQAKENLLLINNMEKEKSIDTVRIKNKIEKQQDQLNSFNGSEKNKLKLQKQWKQIQNEIKLESANNYKKDQTNKQNNQIKIQSASKTPKQQPLLNHKTIKLTIHPHLTPHFISRSQYYPSQSIISPFLKIYQSEQPQQFSNKQFSEFHLQSIKKDQKQNKKQKISNKFQQKNKVYSQDQQKFKRKYSQITNINRINGNQNKLTQNNKENLNDDIIINPQKHFKRRQIKIKRFSTLMNFNNNQENQGIKNQNQHQKFQQKQQRNLNKKQSQNMQNPEN